MIRARLVIWLGLGVLSGVVSVLALRNDNVAPDDTEDISAEAFATLVVNGLVYEEFGERPLHSLRVKRITRQKLRLGPFSLSPFREVVMDDVAITIRPRDAQTSRPSEATDVAGFAARLAGVAQAGGSGKVSRIVMNRLAVRAESDAGPLFVLKAGKAEIGSNPERWELRGGVTVLSRSGQRLAAKRALWLDRGRRIEARGGFEFEQQGEKTAGSAAAFALDAVGGILEPASGEPGEARISNP